MAAQNKFSKTAGTKAGLEIWRIIKMEVNLIDEKEHGQFYSGDCYIVMKTYEKFGRLEMDLHFWLGKNSTQDEQGSCAYWTVALDDQLRGKPVQHREVQEHESELFMSHFPKGIQYLEGGADSAFRKVNPNDYKPRLFQVKGKRQVRVSQVELASKSLNDGDCFILDLGLTIYQWNGKEANKYEKFKALEMVNKIKDNERGGKAKAIFLESGKDDDETFWKSLGGKTTVKSANDGGSDDDVKAAVNTLYNVSDASGSVKVTKVAEGKLEKKMLDSNDAFIVDTGNALFVWIGQKATKEEKNKGMSHATEFLKQQGRPNHTPISRIIEHGETPIFKSLFMKWDEPKKVAPSSVASPSNKPKVADTSALYAIQQKAAEEKMVDDATGKIQIWRIENMAKTELPKELYGQFYQGDSYIVLYSYKDKSGRKDNHIIYFWQGKDSSNDEKGASALLTVQLDDHIKSTTGSDPVQVRVVQNHEPNHFLCLFKGKMVVHSGGFPSYFKGKKEGEAKGETNSLNSKGVALYHIRGTSDYNTKAIQVKEVAASLNSGDCFALVAPNTLFLWLGKGANKHEKDVAASIANVLKGTRKVVHVEEGHEKDDFWGHLGGKGAYSTSKELEEGMKEPRLFHCSNVHGSFKITEVPNFSQDDLINDDVMMLDTYSEVFIWIGHDSTKEEKDEAMKAALAYVKNAPDGRSADTPVYRIFAGAEPPNFSCHFHGWDDSKASDFEDPYTKAQKKTQSSGDAKSNAPEKVTESLIGYIDPSKKSFTFAELQAGIKDIDKNQKEQYLTEDEFKSIFKMSKSEFNAQPKWKKDEQKKKNKLF